MNHSQPDIYPLAAEPSDAATAEELAPLWKSLAVLFKARVVMLLLAAAVAGAFIAAGGWPGFGELALLLICGSFAAGGASAINQYLEQQLDSRMQRTRHRPLAAGSFSRTRWVPWAGTAMILLPALVASLVNPPLALFLLLGAAIYIGVYTIWLKPRTPLNIVIGGAAGSAAVISGSAAAGHWSEPGALVLALLIFSWTPTHFWSLAIAYRDDYARGGFPMLPVQTTPRRAAWWTLLHAGAAAMTALLLATHPALSWLYLAPISVATAALLTLATRLIGRPVRSRALALFHTSNLYLAIILVMICIDSMVG